MSPATTRESSSSPLSISLRDFYESYILTSGNTVSIAYSAFLLGYRIHSVKRNGLWTKLYKVYINNGQEYIQALGDDTVTVFHK